MMSDHMLSRADQSVASEIKVCAVGPPYDPDRMRPFRTPATPTRLPDGTVVLIDLPTTVAQDQLQRTVGRWRERCPTAPIVLRYPVDRPSEIAALTALSIRLGARAALPFEADPTVDLAALLRRVLTDSAGIAEQMLAWFTLRGLHMSPAAKAVVRVILDHTPEHRTVSAVLTADGQRPRVVRRRFQQERLPSPGRWMQLARGTRTALALQATPERPILQSALSFGYSDGSHLSAHLRRTFDVRPALARRALSFEWLLERWLRRHGQVDSPERELTRTVPG